MPGHAKTTSRCGAKTRRGTQCAAKGLANGRCKFHGGMSTGARTPEGQQRCREALERYRAARRAAGEAAICAVS